MLPPLGDRHFEMCRARDAVELMQVVGQHAEIDQSLAKRGLGIDRIIDAGQEHGLVQQQDACIGESANRRRNMCVEFVRVIGVEHDDRRQPGAAEHIDQFVGHALRNHNRQPRMNSQPPQVRNTRERIDQLRQRRIDERQRIAAAENHFVHALVGRDLIDALAANRRSSAAFHRRENVGGNSSGNGWHTCRS